jgi:hypothetical protein
MSKTVRLRVDLNNPPLLTEERKRALKALADMPDSEIDYSDIPPLNESFWRRAVHHPYYKPEEIHPSYKDDDLAEEMRGERSAVSHKDKT